MKTTRLPSDNCPWCGYKMDAATPLSGKATPKPLDLTLCLSCGSVLVFDDTLRVKGITDAEVREALPARDYDELMRARRMLLSMDRTKLREQEP